MLDTRQHPWLGIEPSRESHLETLKDFISRMNKVMDEARSALSQAADDMARFYDAHRREAPLYKVGHKMWLNGQHITMTQLMKELITNGSDHIQSKRLYRGVLTSLSSPRYLAKITWYFRSETLQH